MDQLTFAPRSNLLKPELEDLQPGSERLATEKEHHDDAPV